ncbi:WD40/YVTN/BNR-like repeat-containing protein [Roseisolibacter agri]|uniref:Sortilin N-terminal domain-containing protein n=1 Tax=Roseisolibacter agri TaxID=2014610 RepID=A0AA37QCD8_9BACT|nr:hypothetical protein [Roseisolibacter agri]GLC23700.1 hypothetical protein rosag_02130 [Roseisolibacter agri]
MRAPRLAPALAGLALAGVPSLGAQPVTKDAPATRATSTSATSGAPRSAAMIDSAMLGALRWRPIGPANMGGRVADVEGIPSPSKTFYVAAAGGGIWKTTNNGTTFRPIFDDQRCISMGDLAIAPSDTNVIYAGTGEPNSRNSISPGCGIFKSTNGGRSWTFIGLPKSEHIGRIVVDPRDANVAYVAALGPAWRSGGERGLYKTTDGGATWTLAKSVGEKAGFVDVELDPSNPDVVWAASYERVRGPYFLQSGGPGSGLWKSTDAGKSWTAVKGGGLPTSMLGRIEIAIAASDPKTMYLMVEADTMPNAEKGKKAQTKPSGLYRSQDGGATWERTNNENVRPFYYSQVRVDPKNPSRVYWSSTPVKVSDEGGKNARNATVGIHVDHHAMWIDPVDPQRMIVGNDGGVAISYDRGGSYNFLNHIPIGQFYNISYDMATPYRVCGGLQDNGSWCGPSRRRNGPVTNAMWATVAGGDGFVTAQDPTDQNTVYAESQGGNMSRVDLLTGERTALVKPQWRSRYMQWEDSILTERPDTTQPLTADQRRRLADFRARQRADSADLDIRWNWNTPFFLSWHNPRVFYTGANRVLKSTDRGNNLYFISPDLTTKDAEKIRVSTRTTGGITVDATGAETFSTIVSLNESPVQAGRLYAGTDDGKVWLTRNDGATWDDLTGRFPGVPAGTYVSRIEPSWKDTAVFYVTFDNHRRGDFTPYVYMTRDGGRSFRSIAANLPTGGPNFVHVIREDPVNPDLLYLGTDVGVYTSLDRGGSWQPFMTGLPTVPVHDLRIHPRERELIAGTHGRAIWIVDVAPLQEMSTATLAKATHVFAPKTAFQYGEVPMEGQSAGHQYWAAPSPAYGALVSYRIAPGANVSGPVRVAILGPMGDTLRAFPNAPSTPGVHTLLWDMRGRPAARTLSPAERRDSIDQARRAIAVVDSLVNEKIVPAQMAGQIKDALNGGPQALQQLAARFGAGGGGGGGGFGGGGGAGARGTIQPVGYPRWTERPGETTGGGGAGARGEGASEAAGEGGAPAGGMDQGAMSQVFQAIQAASRGRGQGGFGGRGGGAPLVPTGTYQVAVTINGQTTKVPLRVERVSGTDASGPAFEEEDEEGHEP